MGNILRVLLNVNPPKDENDANQIVDNALATCVHSSRCAVNHTMQTSPGSLVFNRDMIMNIPLIANLYSIQERRQQLIDENLRRTNARRIQHNYNIGDKVMVVEYDPTKLDAKKRGPYPIVCVFTNGTVKLQIAQHVQETFNIRKIWPYKGIIKTQ